MGAPTRHLELHTQAMEQERFIQDSRTFFVLSPCEYCKQKQTGISQCCTQCGAPKSTTLTKRTV